MKKYIYLFIFLVFQISIYAQDNWREQMDSLITDKKFEEALAFNDSISNALIENDFVQKGISEYYYGKIHQIIRKDEEAINYYNSASDYFEKSDDKNHYINGYSFKNNALCHSNKRDYKEAELLYLKAIQILDQSEIKKYQSKALSTKADLASLYSKQSKFEEADKYYNALILEFENKKATGDPLYSKTLNNFGNLKYKQGKYKRAEQLFLRVINNEPSNNVSKYYYDSKTNLAKVYMVKGKYLEAEEILLESKRETLAQHGKDRLYSSCMRQLGILYKRIQVNDKAINCFSEAYSVNAKIYGDNHSMTIGSLRNLAIIYRQDKQLSEAKKYIQKALVASEKKYGTLSYEYVNVLDFAAIFEPLKDQHVVRERIIGILDSLPNKNTIKIKKVSISNAFNLTYLYLKQSDPENAERAVLIAESIVSSLPDLLQTQYNYLYFLKGIIAYMNGEDQDAISNYEKGFKIYFDDFQKKTYFISEDELQKSLHSLNRKIEELMSIYYSSNDKSNAWPFELTQFSKGVLKQSIQQVRNSKNNHPELSGDFKELESTRVKLGKELTKPLEKQIGVASLSTNIDSIEKVIKKQIISFGDNFKEVDFKETINALNDAEAAIEFTHFNFKKRYYSKADSVIYGAFLLKANSKYPQFIPLFEEKELESLVKNNSIRRADYVNQLYQQNGAALHDLIWQPLEKELSGIEKVYYSPSGLLHQINFNALPTTEETLLADRHALHLISNTRQLINLPLPAQTPTNNATLFGGIHYELDSTDIVSISNTENRGFLLEESLSSAQTDTTLRSDISVWNYLPSSQEEVNYVNELLKQSNYNSTVKATSTATEESFKALSKTPGSPSPKIIHIATHGYFVPNTDKNSTNTKKSIFKTSGHPLIRSGLIFAGGNHAWTTGQAFKPDMEDGVLTAYEISQMNLSDTELVVLSACETGLGDIRRYEGVYGLQRAFKIAGVKSIVMSLWQVPDYQTKELMIHFYKNKLEQKMDNRAALLAAQNTLREEGYEPFYWAGFVVLE